ncbi:SDR family NAD(P)-dependent oxidoreductase [Ammoniphilus sp. 3BR4]|uniref:SDR family NAD(P)-dependent oxidoreductase n=1 Tax=Ammoniphilus sp. 3BR4 TaxID=3158265 RepID=UPI003467D0BF
MIMEKFRLSGKVALVTGGASGIGLEYAKAVAEAGANVAVADINLQRAEEAARDLSEKTGKSIIALQADVANESDVEKMVADTVDKLGRLDICFANAGISEGGCSFDEYSKDTWDRVIGINLTGVFLTNRSAAKIMIAQGSGGSIINTASIYGHVGAAGDTCIVGYTAAKAGVVNMTKTLAAELAPYNIRVNSIAPGFIRTNIAGGFMDPETNNPKYLSRQEKLANMTLLKRLGNSEELQGIALFLASEASSYCTGYSYAVDGGWLAV